MAGQHDGSGASTVLATAPPLLEYDAGVFSFSRRCSHWPRFVARPEPTTATSFDLH
jgi:hypothetical protein